MLKKLKLNFLYILGLLLIFYSSSGFTESLNECIRKAILNKIELNKILTLCRENINPLNIYSNDYTVDKSESQSDYISTNKMDKVINEFIEKGELSKASRLVERQEIEKTKRIKARAEAEALKAPQIIATHETSNSSSNVNSNIRSTLALGSNPIKTISAGSKILEITTPGAHGAIAGQFVQITNVDSSIDGIAAGEINKFHVISSVPSITKFRVSVLSSASSGSVSGGGSKVIAIFQD
jgi:hypothetical protein